MKLNWKFQGGGRVTKQITFLTGGRIVLGTTYLHYVCCGSILSFVLYFVTLTWLCAKPAGVGKLTSSEDDFALLV